MCDAPVARVIAPEELGPALAEQREEAGDDAALEHGVGLRAFDPVLPLLPRAAPRAAQELGDVLRRRAFPVRREAQLFEPVDDLRLQAERVGERLGGLPRARGR